MLVNCGALVLDGSRILLVQQSRGRFAGKWNFPLGKLRNDETVIECASREVLEETSIKIRITGLLGMWQSLHVGQEAELLLMFRATPETTEAKPRPSEIGAVRWVDPQGLEDLGDELVHKEMLEAIRLAWKGEVPLERVRFL